jgi:cell division protein FtsA
MSLEKVPHLAVALEVGSSHTSIMVAQRTPTDAAPNILGWASAEHNAMRKGSIVNFEGIVTSIQDVVDEVERQTGLSLSRVRLGVEGCDAAFDNFTHSIPLKNGEVRLLDVERLHAQARGERAPTDSDFIHNLPSQFLLDGKPGIVNPLGMCGSQLACVYHRVAYPQSEIRNLVRACNQAGLHVESIVYEPLSAAEATLDKDEKELGSACITMGSHLTHVAVYHGGAPIFCKGYPFGANHITKDLSIGLRTTQVEAERIKREHGQAVFALTGSQDLVRISEISGRPARDLTCGQVWQIIEPRVSEMLTTIQEDLAKFDLIDQLEKGVVLTGGGALMPGLCLAAERIMSCQTRTGIPSGMRGIIEGLRSPSKASVVGILDPLFSPPEIIPTMIERLGALSSKGGIQTLARSFWSRLSEPFE